MIAPVLEQVAREYEGKLVVAKVNTDENPEWMVHFGIQGIPTLLFIYSGEEKDRQVGVGPTPALKAKVEAFVKTQNPVQTN
jgi:thioredoxin 1